MEQKVVFETDAQRQAALDAELIGATESVVLDDDYVRICCPPEALNSRKPVAFVFWTKETEDDNDPTWEKVVSFILFIFSFGILFFVI